MKSYPRNTTFYPVVTDNTNVAPAYWTLPPGRHVYCCPVCQGRTIVPAGFYNRASITVAVSTEPEPCRSCGQTGIVWS